LLRLNEIEQYSEGNYIFPYGTLEEKKKVVVYGKGKFGNRLIRYIENNEQFELIGWIDGSSIERINGFEFDYILIAVLSADMAIEMKEKLTMSGIAGEKILMVSKDVLSCAERENNIIIFGAGQIGNMALEYYGEERVEYFIDNNPLLEGTSIKNIPVRKVGDAVVDSEKFPIVIASKHYELMEQQLRDLGIENYNIFREACERMYFTNKLVFNPYEESMQRGLSEEQWIKNQENNNIIKTINYQVEQLYKNVPMFNHIEIETVNRCNGTCDFCPVNQKNEVREFAKMDDRLFGRIISQLEEIGYKGRLALFSNNEPLLDDDIIERHKLARCRLPEARIILFTNGTLFTLEKFREIIDLLDELVIDNYHPDLKLIKPCQEIEKYCRNHPELRKKVTIVLRNPHEILTTRGGEAPNRKKMISYENARCILPFKQMIVRPDGKVSLCCNDPYGKNTLGDLTNETVMDVWMGEHFRKVRDCLYKGRSSWEYCRFCDTFSSGK